jgi:hypothetical protein
LDPVSFDSFSWESEAVPRVRLSADLAFRTSALRPPVISCSAFRPCLIWTPPRVCSPCGSLFVRGGLWCCLLLADSALPLPCVPEPGPKQPSGSGFLARPLPRLWRPTWALRHVTDVCFQSYAVPVLQFPGMLRVQNGLPISRDSLTSVSQPLQTNLRFLDLRGLLRPALTPSGLAWTSVSRCQHWAPRGLPAPRRHSPRQAELSAS